MQRALPVDRGDRPVVCILRFSILPPSLQFSEILTEMRFDRVFARHCGRVDSRQLLVAHAWTCHRGGREWWWKEERRSVEDSRCSDVLPSGYDTLGAHVRGDTDFPTDPISGTRRLRDGLVQLVHHEYQKPVPLVCMCIYLLYKWEELLCRLGLCQQLDAALRSVIHKTLIFQGPAK